jgi:hypothetical protein
MIFKLESFPVLSPFPSDEDSRLIWLGAKGVGLPLFLGRNS